MLLPTTVVFQAVENPAHPYVLGVQAVLAPGRGDAVVEVGAGPAHVQLLLVGLRGDVLPGLCPRGQELRSRRRRNKCTKWLFWTIFLSCSLVMVLFYFRFWPTAPLSSVKVRVDSSIIPRSRIKSPQPLTFVIVLLFLHR